MTRPWEAEFARYYQTRVHMLRRTAYLMCCDWHEAEDLVQTVFVKLYQRWRKVRPPTADAYTRQILVTTFITTRRRRRSGEVPMATPPDHPTAAPEASDDRLTLLAALRGLPPRQRATAVLRYWEDLSVAETAALLDVSEGTVKSQSARAMAVLREVLTDHNCEGVIGHG